jgi:hypothetical protein
VERRSRARDNAATDSGRDEWPRLETDGSGTWIAAWSSDDDLSGTIGTDFDNLFSRSTDDGVSWSSPAALNINAATDGFATDSDTLDMTTDGIDTWIAVWNSNNDVIGPIGTDHDLLFTRSTDDGLNWSTPAVLNSDADSDGDADSFPALAADGAGNWVAFWVKSFELRTAQSSDGGQTWSDPVVVEASLGSVLVRPQLATDGAGNWTALWESKNSLGTTIGTDFDILRADSTDDGISWSAPSAVESNAASDSGDDLRPHLTTDGLGNWVAVWSSDDDLGATIGTDKDILISDGFGPDRDGDGLNDGSEVNFYGTDPLDTDSDGDGIEDGDEVAVGLDPADEDTDDDLACDGGNQVGVCTLAPDNCPHISNAAQTNSDALEAGDDCQCGDVTNDGSVTATDVARARENLLGLPPGGTFVANRCNVIGPSDGGVSDCDVADIFVLQRFMDGGSVTIENTCDGYSGP